LHLGGHLRQPRNSLFRYVALADPAAFRPCSFGGKQAQTDIERARPVEQWLATLDLSPKSKVHIRGLLHLLWDFAMYSEVAGTERNPMELVKVKNGNSSVRTRDSPDIAMVCSRTPRH
jgi:hypothetical protein